MEERGGGPDGEERRGLSDGYKSQRIGSRTESGERGVSKGLNSEKIE